MFLRSYKRKKNGKWHEYFSVVENRRVVADKTVQRTVLYLGEITSSQENRWRKTLDIFDEDSGKYEQKMLFADHAVITESELDAIKVKLSQMQLCRPRWFGNCWLGCRLWQELDLDEFWQQRLDESRGDIAWSKVIKLLVTNCLIDPASEFYVHRQRFDKTAMDELLDTDCRIASKDRLYRCLDRILTPKEDLCKHLKSQGEDMFGIEFDVLLYDLTSTYFEGLCEQNPKAKFGYSRDKRSDCRQVVIALVVTPEGFPTGYEVLPGNTLDKTTLRMFLKKVESMYGKARRVWIMDREGQPAGGGLGFIALVSEHDRTERGGEDHRPMLRDSDGARVACPRGPILRQTCISIATDGAIVLQKKYPLSWVSDRV